MTPHFVSLGLLAAALILGTQFNVRQSPATTTHFSFQQYHQEILEIQNEIHSLKQESVSMTTTLDTFLNSNTRVKPTQNERFYLEDFERFFMVEPIHENQAQNPFLEEMLQAHDITTDKSFVDFDLEDHYTQEYTPFLETSFKNDKRFYIAHTGDDIRGYGCFAAVGIQKGKLLGEFTGIITNSSVDSSYQWTYNSLLKNEQGQDMTLFIDGKTKGSMLRFVNREEKSNAEVIQVAYKGRWRILFVATHFIPKDTEVFVNYGDSYWLVAGRTKFLSLGKLSPKELAERKMMESHDYE